MHNKTYRNVFLRSWGGAGDIIINYFCDFTPTDFNLFRFDCLHLSPLGMGIIKPDQRRSVVFLIFSSSLSISSSFCLNFMQLDGCDNLALACLPIWHSHYHNALVLLYTFKHFMKYEKCYVTKCLLPGVAYGTCCLGHVAHGWAFPMRRPCIFPRQLIENCLISYNLQPLRLQRQAWWKSCVSVQSYNQVFITHTTSVVQISVSIGPPICRSLLQAFVSLRLYRKVIVYLIANYINANMQTYVIQSLSEPNRIQCIPDWG